MKILKELIKLHRFLFAMAVFFILLLIAEADVAGAVEQAKYKEECLDNIIDNIRVSESAENCTSMLPPSPRPFFLCMQSRIGIQIHNQRSTMKIAMVIV